MAEILSGGLNWGSTQQAIVTMDKEGHPLTCCNPVTGECLGGGGSSDFSTAEVTVRYMPKEETDVTLVSVSCVVVVDLNDFDIEGYTNEDSFSLEKQIENEAPILHLPINSTIANNTRSVITNLQAHFSNGTTRNISTANVTGGITVEEYGFVVTGDGTITIS